MISRDSSKAKKSKTRQRSWSPVLIDFLLILIARLSGSAKHTTCSQRRAGARAPETAVAATTASTRTIPEAKIFVRSFDGYRNIWQRNLYSVSKETPSAPLKEMSLDKLALAQKISA